MLPAVTARPIAAVASKRAPQSGFEVARRLEAIARPVLFENNGRGFALKAINAPGLEGHGIDAVSMQRFRTAAVAMMKTDPHFAMPQRLAWNVLSPKDSKEYLAGPDNELRGQLRSKDDPLDTATAERAYRGLLRAMGRQLEDVRVAFVGRADGRGGFAEDQGRLSPFFVVGRAPDGQLAGLMSGYVQS